MAYRGFPLVATHDYPTTRDNHASAHSTRAVQHSATRQSCTTSRASTRGQCSVTDRARSLYFYPGGGRS